MDIQNIDLFQKIGESERELTLLRDDLKAANLRNEELCAELKTLKAERDQLQKNMDLFQKMGENERELSLLRDDLKVANARIEELIVENRTLKAELDEKRSTAIVNTVARSDLDEKLKMSIFQNTQLQEENDFLKSKIDRLEADQSIHVHVEPSLQQNDDNPFEYHVPYLKSVLYKEEYFPGNIRFEDYDFGHIVVGEVAVLRGHIYSYFDKEDAFQLNGDDLKALSVQAFRGVNTYGYKYVGIDKEKQTAMVEYNACSNNGRICRQTIDIPLMACLNSKELNRWDHDYTQYQISQEDREQTMMHKRGIFKRR